MSTPKSQLSAADHRRKRHKAKDIKKEPQQDGYMGQTQNRIKTHTSRRANYKLENNCRGSPTGVRVLSPELGSSAQGSALGREAPRAFGFEGLERLTFGSPKGLGEIKTSLLKDAHKMSGPLGPRRKAVINLVGPKAVLWSWRVSRRD